VNSNNKGNTGYVEYDNKHIIFIVDDNNINRNDFK